MGVIDKSASELKNFDKVGDTHFSEKFQDVGYATLEASGELANVFADAIVKSEKVAEKYESNMKKTIADKDPKHKNDGKDGEKSTENNDENGNKEGQDEKNNPQSDNDVKEDLSNPTDNKIEDSNVETTGKEANSDKKD